jgi:hypothetical protein
LLQLNRSARAGFVTLCANFIAQDIYVSHNSHPATCSESKDTRVVRNVGKYSPVDRPRPRRREFSFFKFLFPVRTVTYLEQLGGTALPVNDVRKCAIHCRQFWRDKNDFLCRRWIFMHPGIRNISFPCSHLDIKYPHSTISHDKGRCWDCRPFKSHCGPQNWRHYVSGPRLEGLERNA